MAIRNKAKEDGNSYELDELGGYSFINLQNKEKKFKSYLPLYH